MCDAAPPPARSQVPEGQSVCLLCAGASPGDMDLVALGRGLSSCISDKFLWDARARVISSWDSCAPIVVASRVPKA